MDSYTWCTTSYHQSNNSASSINPTLDHVVVIWMYRCNRSCMAIHLWLFYFPSHRRYLSSLCSSYLRIPIEGLLANRSSKFAKDDNHRIQTTALFKDYEVIHHELFILTHFDESVSSDILIYFSREYL